MKNEKQVRRVQKKRNADKKRWRVQKKNDDN